MHIFQKPFCYLKSPTFHFFVDSIVFFLDFRLTFFSYSKNRICNLLSWSSESINGMEPLGVHLLNTKSSSFLRTWAIILLVAVPDGVIVTIAGISFPHKLQVGYPLSALPFPMFSSNIFLVS